jgi:ABC-type sugar transport system permease subunit
MKKISIRGILIGGVINVGGSLLLTTVLVVSILTWLQYQAGSRAGYENLIMNDMKANPVYRTLYYLIVYISPVLGGFVSAKIARHNELLNGLLASILGLSVALHLLGVNRTEGSVGDPTNL